MRIRWVVLALALAMSGCSEPDHGPVVDSRCWADKSSCVQVSRRQGWVFRIASETAYGPGFFRLDVTAPDDFDDTELLTVWKGREMYMGAMPVPLTPVSGQRWTAIVGLPDCSIDPGMTWEMELRGPSGSISLPSQLVLEER